MCNWDIDATISDDCWEKYRKEMVQAMLYQAEFCAQLFLVSGPGLVYSGGEDRGIGRLFVVFLCPPFSWSIYLFPFP